MESCNAVRHPVGPVNPALLATPEDVTASFYGLFPVANFYQTKVPSEDCATEGASLTVTDVAWHGEPLAQAIWYFRGETIACPLPEMPVAGFERHLSVWEDLRQWVAKVTQGQALRVSVPASIQYPTLIWLGAPHFVESAHLLGEGERLHCSDGELALTLAPRLASNRAFFNADSLAFFQSRAFRLRGFRRDGEFEARTLWPCDWRLNLDAAPEPITATPVAIRSWVRASTSLSGEGFSTRVVWQRAPHTAAAAGRAGRPILGLMLNGAQGDDDEAHGGHFGLLTGRVGTRGEMHDWLMANFYTLDSESEKGILSAMLPLDNYLADLNSGQSWYRPSWLLVATLREERATMRISSALARVFSQFYRHQFAYRHATDNCAGISLSVLRTLGWQVPTLGVSSRLKAFLAMIVVSLQQRSLAKGRAMFDYFSEERTRLFPALAFEQAGADLLQLALGRVDRQLTPFEAMLRDDIEEIRLVHLPQLPSSRVAGSFPVTSIDEYQARVPKDPQAQQIIPVAPRPFPSALKDPLAPAWVRQRSERVLAWLSVAGAGVAAGLGGWLLMIGARACLS